MEAELENCTVEAAGVTLTVLILDDDNGKLISKLT